MLIIIGELSNYELFLNYDWSHTDLCVNTAALLHVIIVNALINIYG